MFRITEDPSSGSLAQSLAKNDKNGSIVSVDMYRVGVMAAYCDLLCVWAVHCVGACVQFTVWEGTVGHDRALLHVLYFNCIYKLHIVH
jgi:hypothetical protein